MAGRLLFNVLLFATLLAGIGGFLLHERGEALSVADVVVVALLGSLWAGTIVSIIEVKIYAIAETGKRVGLAALAGALAYVGLFSGVAFLSASQTFADQPSVAMSWRPSFAFLGLLIGALSHGVRARIYGGKSDKPEE